MLRNLAGKGFADATMGAGVARQGWLNSTFGLRFLDVDNDGHLDVIMANGHPLDSAELTLDSIAAAEPMQLLQGAADGRFRDATSAGGPALAQRLFGCGLATGDVNNDGFPDVLVGQNAGQPLLLMNTAAGGNHWLGIKLIGHASSRDAVGAIVRVTAGGRQQTHQLVGGASYASSSDARLLFGLGGATSIENVEVRWPSGSLLRKTALQPDRYYTLEEDLAAKPRREASTP